MRRDGFIARSDSAIQRGSGLPDIRGIVRGHCRGHHNQQRGEMGRIRPVGGGNRIAHGLNAHVILGVVCQTRQRVCRIVRHQDGIRPVAGCRLVLEVPARFSIARCPADGGGGGCNAGCCHVGRGAARHRGNANLNVIYKARIADGAC